MPISGAYSNSLIFLQNSIIQINRISMVKWQTVQFGVSPICYMLRHPVYHAILSACVIHEHAHLGSAYALNQASPHYTAVLAHCCFASK